MTADERAQTIENLMAAAFGRPRDPRSDEYKQGTRAVLNFKLGGGAPKCAYPLGTASADAFFSGMQEGHAIWGSQPPLQPTGDDHGS
jgi:hypothetical protein